MDINSFDEINEEFCGNKYVFKYVGIIMVGNCCFFLIPST